MRCGQLLAIIASGCNHHPTSSVDADSTCAGFATGPIGGDRPVEVHVPPGYDCTPTPLVIMLHGYSASGPIEEAYLQVKPVADARNFLYAYPDGMIDSRGYHFWNATDACCNFDGSTVDDSAYLSQLVVEIGQHYNVDPARVFFMGHSNGGFMSYRMACDHADQIAAIASLAGAMWNDVSRCKPTTTVATLEIHGTADTTIKFAGGLEGSHAYPGAQTTVTDWATLDGCTTTADTSPPPLDLDTSVAGAETTITTYASGCRPGGGGVLWTMTGSEHIPPLSSQFAADVIDFLLSHPKPSP